MTAAFFKRQARIVAFIASVLLNLMVAPAFAACTTPAGNEGDINYVSSLHVMVYCNGTSWIGMGVSQPVSFGTLTTNDFCTATSGTAIACTTAAINLTSQVTGVLTGTNGGTGINNGASTITLGGNLTTSGAFPLTLATTASTSVTLPVTGTLVNTAVTTLSSLASIGTITIGIWNGTAIGPIFGGTGQTAYATGDILYASAANTLSRLAAGSNGNVLTLSGGVPSWVVPVPTFSGLTTSDFCTAASGTAIVCNTGFTGTGVVVLAASPTLIGTVTGASSNWSGSVGIGTTAPNYLLSVSNNTAALPVGNTGTVAQFGTVNGTNTRVLLDAFAAAGALDLRRADTTAASPSAVQSGENIGQITWFGYGTTGYSASGRALIRGFADQNWTDSAQGTDMTFATTPDGSTTAAEIMRITAGGNVGIGTTNPQKNVTTRKALIVSDLVNDAGIEVWGSASGKLDLESVGGSSYIGNLGPSGGATNLLAGAATTVMTLLGSGHVGINTTSPGYPLDVRGGTALNTCYYALSFGGPSGSYCQNAGNAPSSNGCGIVSIQAAATIIAGEFDALSDFRKKKDIDSIQPQDGVYFVEKVNPVHFRWKKEAADAGISHGYIAQQLITAGYPSLVHLSKDETMKAERVAFDNGYVDSPAGASFEANYLGVIPYLHAALRKVLQDFETLKADNDNLRAANDNEAAQIKALTARLDALEASRH